MAPGIIFDLDGTLADTLDDITAGVNYALGAAAAPPFTTAQVQSWVGDGIGELMARASGLTDAAQLKALIRRFREHARRHCLDRTRLFPGWSEVLATLRADRVPMAVLSNKPHDITCRICAALLPADSVLHVEGQIDGYPRKPDPTRALAIAHILSRTPETTWLVGDSNNDIGAAQAAGMRPIGVAWGFRPAADLRRWGADVIIDAPQDLVDLIG